MLEVKYRNTDELIPYARNARTHSESQIAQIAASISIRFEDLVKYEMTEKSDFYKKVYGRKY